MNRLKGIVKELTATGDWIYVATLALWGTLLSLMVWAIMFTPAAK